MFAYPAPFSSSGALALAFAHGTPVLLSAPLGRCVGAPDEVVVPDGAEALSARLRSLIDPAARARLAMATAGLAADPFRRRRIPSSVAVSKSGLQTA